ncbi:hypothetical protein [Marinimicrobium sp. ABcell2]|uniref:hypothetical protein n=1 Tax=Marinimicrobium sp. ABcell2 TaxID=3069751 RepID=UPI0027B44115|nr:hypothetical protein [Marinimicrobium sp. ABcell2]MDQ2077391.1 hypothetical protein [Marinimicrobium sp. ABcell2]
MSDDDVQVLEERAESLLIRIEAQSESAAIEQAERWAKLEGLEVADIARVLGKGPQSATEGAMGGSPPKGLGLYYDLKIIMAAGDYSPKTIKLDQVTQ